MDVVYIRGMLYAGSRLKPIKGAAFSHVVDTAFSNIKDGVAPTLSETEAKKDFISGMRTLCILRSSFGFLYRRK